MVSVPSSADFHLHEVGGLRILFVMALPHEYGPHLQSMISPLMTGVGPVEAAAATAGALAQLEAEGRRPHLVFSLGSAGSRNLEHAGVYQISSVSYRDMDASVLGFERGLTPFLGEPAVIPILSRLEGVPAASIATGASVVSGAGYDRIEADMVDMESYAVLRAARRFRTPMVGLRGISDGQGELNGLGDWTEYLHVLDQKLAAVLEGFFDQVNAGRFLLHS